MNDIFWKYCKKTIKRYVNVVYQSYYGMGLHIGLSYWERIDRIEVHWIGGGIDVFEDVAVDQLLTLTEGSSKTKHNWPQEILFSKAVLRDLFLWRPA